MGRPPKLTEIKKLEGNPGKRPLKPTLKAGSGVPACPVYMSDTAKKWWRKTVPQLKKLGVLSQVDLGILEAAAVAYSLMDSAIRVMKNELPVYKNIDGEVKIHNLHVIYRQNVELYVRLSNELGLSPLARQRISANINSEAVDPEEEILAKLIDG